MCVPFTGGVLLLRNVVNEEKYTLYINNAMELKVKVIKKNAQDEVYMNYKGYNLTVPMFIWEFQEDLCLASIEDFQIEGESEFDQHFVINHKDRERFLDEIYFFLVDNNMESVLKERYLVTWE